MLASFVLAAAVTGLLMPVPFVGRVSVAVGDMVHAPLFGGLALGTLVLLQLVRPIHDFNLELLLRSLLVFAIVSGLGVGIEYAQASLGRTATVHDAVSNGLGVLTAVLWYSGHLLRRLQPNRRALPWSFAISGLAMIAISWWAPVMMLRDAIAVHREFPKLASFESYAELQRLYFRECKGKLTTDHVTDGGLALEVEYEATPYPAATLVELHQDWTKVETLSIDVTLVESNSADEAHLMLKVYDREHNGMHQDTFRQNYRLVRGVPTTITINREELLGGPDDRRLNISQVLYVDLLLIKPPNPTCLVFDHMRLKLND